MVEVAGHYELRPDPDCRLLADDEQGRLCSQPRCQRPAVFVLLRRVYRWRTNGSSTRRWFCCDNEDHCYRRQIIDGVVHHQAWIWDET